MLPDFDRADAIGSYGGEPQDPHLLELLVDCEEDRTVRAVPVGMLREGDSWRRSTLAASGSGRPP
jgi:hypothetical protein